MKGISYSLFGYNEERKENCFTFETYIRGLMVNVRMNRLLYHDWVNIINIDERTYKPFKKLFDNIGADVYIHDEAPLCKAMLWRLKPVFMKKYTHIICRDTDSPATYREAQCVAQWIQHDKTMHAITDSVSHTIPLMGGMIGFNVKYNWRLGVNNWDELVNQGNYDWNVKGTDQTFLNKFIYPKVANSDDSITQHYMLGMRNTWLSDYHITVPNIDLGLQEGVQESNDVCGHIGAAGYYTGPLNRFLNKYYDQFEDLREAESNYPDVFYWLKEKTF